MDEIDVIKIDCTLLARQGTPKFKAAKQLAEAIVEAIERLSSYAGGFH